MLEATPATPPAPTTQNQPAASEQRIKVTPVIPRYYSPVFGDNGAENSSTGNTPPPASSSASTDTKSGTTQTPDGSQKTPAEPSSGDAEKKGDELTEVQQKLRELTQRERHFALRDRELRQREQRIKETEKGLREWQEAKRLAKVHTRKFLEQHELDLDTVVQAFASDDGKPQNAEVTELKQRLEQMQQEQADRDLKTRKDELERQKTAFKGGIGEYIQANKDGAAELTALEGEAAIDVVYDIIEQRFKDTAPKNDKGQITGPGEQLSFEKAVEIYEEYLYKQQEKRFTSSKKLQAKFGAPQSQQKTEPPPAPKAPPISQTQSQSQARQAPVENRPPTTITHVFSGTAPSRGGEDRGPKDRAERLRWALQFKGRDA